MSALRVMPDALAAWRAGIRDPIVSVAGIAAFDRGEPVEPPFEWQHRSLADLQGDLLTFVAERDDDWWEAFLRGEALVAVHPYGITATS